MNKIKYILFNKKIMGKKKHDIQPEVIHSVVKGLYSRCQFSEIDTLKILTFWYFWVMPTKSDKF